MPNLQGKIEIIKQAKNNIKSAIIGKGVTPTGNISTYADAIDNIVTPNNQTKTVTENGVVRYDTGYTGLEQVTVNIQPTLQSKTTTVNGLVVADNGYYGLSSVNVEVPNGITNIYDNYIIWHDGNIGFLTNQGFVLNKEDTHLTIDNVFNSAYQNTSIQKVSLASLEQIYCNYGFIFAFKECTNLTNIDFRSLIIVNGRSVFGELAAGCTNLVNVNFDSLEKIKGRFCFENAFIGCTSLQNLSFPSLTSYSGSLEFSDEPFKNMLYGVTGCIVHFPSNLQSVIGSWADVQNGFGGTNTTVLFDLPATT